MSALIGVDIGGSGVRCGLVSRSGELRGSGFVGFESGGQDDRTSLIRLIERASDEQGADQLVAIGIGASGPVDTRRGTIENPHTLPLWLQGELVAPLAEHFGVPAVIENDANAAALGEYWRGAGQGARRLLCVTVGTGIGVGFVRGGEVERGVGGEHGEAGHHLLDPTGPPCYCGALGCWESLCSGAAIARAAGATKAAGAAAVATAARAGDRDASEVIDAAARHLGRGLVNSIAFLAPDRIILGGRVMASYDLFRDRIEEVLEAHASMVPTAEVEVLPAELGEAAGLIGAAYAAKESTG